MQTRVYVCFSWCARELFTHSDKLLNAGLSNADQWGEARAGLNAREREKFTIAFAGYFREQLMCRLCSRKTINYVGFEKLDSNSIKLLSIVYHD